MLTITIDRDDISFEDAHISHQKTLTFLSPDISLSQLLQVTAQYVPSIKNVIWVVRTSQEVLGYLLTDTSGKLHIEIPDSLLHTRQLLKNEKIYCKYYDSSSFISSDAKSGKLLTRYPECATLLEKVKKEVLSESVR